MDGHYLLSVGGTGHHSSKKVHCGNCCRKVRRDGSITYCHMIPSAILAHSDEREVFPLAPEPIMRSDGERKNDCEKNAAKLYALATKDGGRRGDRRLVVAVRRSRTADSGRRWVLRG